MAAWSEATPADRETGRQAEILRWRGGHSLWLPTLRCHAIPMREYRGSHGEMHPVGTDAPRGREAAGANRRMRRAVRNGCKRHPDTAMRRLRETI